MSESNLERLETAGLVDSGSLSDDEKKAVESLSGEEVEHVIATGHKIGADPGRTPTHQHYAGF